MAVLPSVIPFWALTVLTGQPLGSLACSMVPMCMLYVLFVELPVLVVVMRFSGCQAQSSRQYGEMCNVLEGSGGVLRGRLALLYVSFRAAQRLYVAAITSHCCTVGLYIPNMPL